MNIEELRTYCLSKPRVTEHMPFGDNALVFKVMDKMFALTNLEGELKVSLKCDPELAVELREQYPEVTPAYHFNKKHWNTVLINGSVDRKTICEWIDNSYDLVVKKLPLARQKEIINKKT